MIYSRILSSIQRYFLESDSESILDPTNRRLLAELEADARISVAELGRRVGLSAPAVGERMGRLERAGVISQGRGRLTVHDPEALEGYVY